MSRADDMYASLMRWPDVWTTRRELFSDVDRFYLTNNAASEVRAKYGVQVEHKLIDGEHCYRIVEPRAGAAVGSPPDSPPLAEQPAAGLAQAAVPEDPLYPLPPGQLSLA